MNIYVDEIFLAEEIKFFEECFPAPDSNVHVLHKSMFGSVTSWKDITFLVKSLCLMVLMLVKTRGSIKRLAKTKLNEFNIGSIVCSTAVRSKRLLSYSDLKFKHFFYLSVKLFKSIYAYQKSNYLIVTKRPQAFIFHDFNFTPYAEFFHLSVQLGVDTVNITGGHCDDAFFLKRYNQKYRIGHPHSIYDLKETLKNTHISQADMTKAMDTLYGWYDSGQWYAEVGTQANIIADAQFELETDKSTQVFTIFPHIFYDTTSMFGADIFADYYDWFVKLIQFAAKTEGVIWVIKRHPGNLIKDKRDNVESINEKKIVMDVLGELPPHFVFIEPESSVSTLKIIEKSDVVLTVRGTVGLEAAVLGKIVLTAGTGRYDRMGFTLDSDDEQQYFEQLNQLINKKLVVNTTNRNLALKYFFVLFFKRPFYLKGYFARFNKEQEFRLEFGVLNSDLIQSDQHKFREFILSSEIDYIGQ